MLHTRRSYYWDIFQGYLKHTISQGNREKYLFIYSVEVNSRRPKCWRFCWGHLHTRTSGCRSWSRWDLISDRCRSKSLASSDIVFFSRNYLPEVTELINNIYFIAFILQWLYHIFDTLWCLAHRFWSCYLWGSVGSMQACIVQDQNNVCDVVYYVYYYFF